MIQLTHQHLTARNKVYELLKEPLKLRMVAWRLGIKPRLLAEFLEASPLELRQKFPRWGRHVLQLASFSPATLAFFISDVQRDSSMKSKVITDDGQWHPDLTTKWETWTRPRHSWGVTSYDAMGKEMVVTIEILRRNQDLADKLFMTEIQAGWVQIIAHESFPQIRFC